MIRTALDEAKALEGTPCPYPESERAGAAWRVVHRWDRGIMARDWIARATPDRREDECGYLLSFQHCCEVLGLNADYEATWMLSEIDECADFDADEVHARVQYLTDNPPDDVKEEKFKGMRVVPAVDQMTMFGNIAA
jgi:hypothetical protein